MARFTFKKYNEQATKSLIIDGTIIKAPATDLDIGTLVEIDATTKAITEVAAKDDTKTQYLLAGDLAKTAKFAVGYIIKKDDELVSRG